MLSVIWLSLLLFPRFCAFSFVNWYVLCYTPVLSQWLAWRMSCQHMNNKELNYYMFLNNWRYVDASPAIPHFPTLSYKRHKFRNNVNKMLWFSRTYLGLHVKYPLFVWDCNETSIFATDLLKILKVSNFMRIRPVGAEFFHSDGRTDGHMTMLLAAFLSLANASKKCL